MTPIADMVEQMLAAGTPAAAIVLAVRTIETVTSQCVTRDVTRDAGVTDEASPGAIRTRRYRENLKQKQASAAANDPAMASYNNDAKRHAGRHESVTCDANEPLLSINTVGTLDEGSKQESKRDVVARARGTRMQPGAELTEAYISAAIDLGAAPMAVPAMWAEHVDFWVGVPGQRGVKLDWLATWRNDVRRKLERGHHGQRRPQQSLSDLAFDLAEQARSAERARGIG